MKKLKIDKLLKYTKSKFDTFRDTRADNKQYSMGNAVQSALAMFSLKDSSMLEYNNRITEREKNLARIYHIDVSPPEGQVREILDEIAPIQIEKVKRGIFRQVQEAGLLKEFEYFPGYHLLAVDGVHHFSSKSISCSGCLTRVHKDGTTTYSHSMLASVLVHPEKKVVLPLCEEPIIQQDGQTKNDCESNAGKRLFDKTRTRHLDLKFIRLEDALYANSPHIEKIQSEGNKFIITVKEGSGAGSVLQQYWSLLAQYESKGTEEQLDESYKEHKLFKRHGIKKPMAAKPQLVKLVKQKGKLLQEWHYVNKLYLNECNKNKAVNFVHYEERLVNNGVDTGTILKQFDWITDIRVTTENVAKIARAGRSRWKIENETFNTLKNQGYHFKHNYGHGEKNLCTNFALLMILAFMIDQIQQLCNEQFQKMLEKKKWKKYIWEDIRSFFRTLPFDSMDMIYQAILYGVKVEYLAIQQDSG